MTSEEHRRASVEHWQAAAGGWARRQATFRVATAPVSDWMVRAIDPQPGNVVLDLAAGIGETGFQAAALVAPGGRVISSDQSEAMIAAGRLRAQELDVENVEFKVLLAEWIDLPVASVDGVLCRWGYMEMADPATALGETRRVLRPGGRLSLAVWDVPEHNPGIDMPMQIVRDRGLVAARDPDAPGPFALSNEQRVRGLLADAGFLDIEQQAIDLDWRYPDFAELWEHTLDVSRGFHDAVMSRPAAEIDEMRAEMELRAAPYVQPDGSLSVPGRALVAAASA